MISRLQEFFKILYHLWILKHSPRFDGKWYLERYPDVKARKQDPAGHYLLHGWRENRQPSPLFDGVDYIGRYPDVRKADVNPLVHYELFGRAEGRKYYSRSKPYAGLKTNLNVLRYINGALCNAEITVIIPVYNQPELLRKCAESLLRYTPDDAELCFVNDCSPDPQIGVLLADIQKRAPHRVTVLSNERNLGYPAACNRGIEHAGRRDVVLLNSDTMVTPRWLDELKIAAYGDAHVGTVSAVSNNSGFVSVPVPKEAGPSGADPEIPEELPSLEVLSQVGRAYLHREWEICNTPTGHGFCMYIKRAMLDDTGLLDQETFRQGYGEETDLCLRAYRLGWMHRITSRAFVWHRNAASFGASKRERVVKAGEIISRRYPEFEFRKETMKDILRRKMARFADMRHLFDECRTPERPRILFVVGVKTGGTYWTNLDLMKNIRDRYAPYMLLSNGRTLELYDFSGPENEYQLKDKGRLIAAQRLTDEFTFFDGRSDEMDQIILFWIVHYGIEIVHIRHMAHISVGFVANVHRMHIPIIFSFHDLFTVSPAITLVDWQGVFHPEGIHDGITTPSAVVLSRRRPIPLPSIDEGIADRWKALYSKHVFLYCRHFITTCGSVRKLLMDHFPILAEKSSVFTIIPHGRDIEPHDFGEKTIDPSSPIKILFLGNFTVTKGANRIIGIADSDGGHRVQFHLTGGIQSELEEKAKMLSVSGNFVLHGKYSRGEEKAIVQDIAPHMAILPSLCPETWCHALTECWAMGLPVITFDVGALGERMKNVGGGWLMPLTSTPEEMLREIIRIAKHPNEYIDKRNAVLRWQTGAGKENTTAKMADRYCELYDRVLRAEN